VSARLLLFDIDGTLVLTGGAGKRAMDRAFEELFGVSEAFAEVSMAGRTDRWLVESALDRHGIPATPARLEQFRARYLALLEASIGETGAGRRGVMPGVPDVLARLGALDHAHLALLTGNYARGAHIKLAHFGLWDHFAWGAFGDDYAERDALARAAVADAAARGIPLADPSHAVVIGDTPFDIACARAAGARAVAVATGGHSIDELQAHDPDLALEDLRDIDTLVAFLARA
jgi:phosphoglycolate phosphatase-like HAD superfamily hydrolase